MGQHQKFDFGYGGMLHANKTAGSERWCKPSKVRRKGNIDRSQGCGKRVAGHQRPVPLRHSAEYVVARRHEIVIILGEIIDVNRRTMRD